MADVSPWLYILGSDIRVPFYPGQISKSLQYRIAIKVIYKYQSLNGLYRSDQMSSFQYCKTSNDHWAMFPNSCHVMEVLQPGDYMQDR